MVSCPLRSRCDLRHDPSGHLRQLHTPYPGQIPVHNGMYHRPGIRRRLRTQPPDIKRIPSRSGYRYPVFFKAPALASRTLAEGDHAGPRRLHNRLTSQGLAMEQHRGFSTKRSGRKHVLWAGDPFRPHRLLPRHRHRTRRQAHRQAQSRLGNTSVGKHTKAAKISPALLQIQK